MAKCDDPIVMMVVNTYRCMQYARQVLSTLHAGTHPKIMTVIYPVASLYLQEELKPREISLTKATQWRDGFEPRQSDSKA